jgi:hypothetical protein
MTSSHLFYDVCVGSSPIRFAVEVDGIQHKLFSYFPIGSDVPLDSSIALQTYYETTHTAQKCISYPPSALSPEEQTFSISRYEKEATEFSVQKFSFHQSGVLTTKNKKGLRLSDDRDARSLSFDNIPDFARLCYIYPVHYTKYPVVHSNENEAKGYYMVRISQAMAEQPSMFDIRVSRKECASDLEGRLKSAYVCFIAFRDTTTLSNCGLDIYVVFRKSPNSFFPRAEAVVIETY